mgnify:FL=1
MLSASYFSRLLGEHLQLSLELAAAESPPCGTAIALVVIGIISALGCIFNIITTFLLKLHLNVLGKMIIFLSIADIIFTISFIIEIQSSIVEIIFSMSWTASVTMLGCFAHTLYRTVKSDEEAPSNVLLKKYIITCFVISALIGVLCIDPSLDTFVYSSLGTLALAAIVYSIFCYIFVLKKLLEIKREIHLELLVYPLFLIICEFPFIVVQFHVIFKGQLPSAEFKEVSMLLLVSRGLLNSLAYGLSARVRLGFKSLCKSKTASNQRESYFTSFTDRFSMAFSVKTLKTPNYVLYDSTLLSQNESVLRSQHTQTNLIDKPLI